jgi:tartrate dehydratase beta subunit/fumarate hydratase class I family protein
MQSIYQLTSSKIASSRQSMWQQLAVEDSIALLSVEYLKVWLKFDLH